MGEDKNQGKKDQQDNDAKNAAKNKAKYNKDARRRYNKAHYRQIIYEEKIEIVEAFREKCKKEGIPQASVLRKAILEFLDDGADEAGQ